MARIEFEDVQTLVDRIAQLERERDEANRRSRTYDAANTKLVEQRNTLEFDLKTQTALLSQARATTSWRAERIAQLERENAAYAECLNHAEGANMADAMRIAQLERELTEARAAWKGADEYAQKYHEQARAAEARLAAVAPVLALLDPERLRADKRIPIDVKLRLADAIDALSAPAEPNRGGFCD